MNDENKLKVKLEIDGKYRYFFLKKIEYEDSGRTQRDDDGNICRDSEIKRVVTLIEY